MAGHFTYNYQRNSLRNLVNNIGNRELQASAEAFQQSVDKFISGLDEEFYATDILSMIMHNTVQTDPKGIAVVLKVTSWMACFTKAMGEFKSGIEEVGEQRVTEGVCVTFLFFIGRQNGPKSCNATSSEFCSAF